MPTSTIVNAAAAIAGKTATDAAKIKAEQLVEWTVRQIEDELDSGIPHETRNTTDLPDQQALIELAVGGILWRFSEAISNDPQVRDFTYNRVIDAVTRLARTEECWTT